MVQIFRAPSSRPKREHAAPARSTSERCSGAWRTRHHMRRLVSRPSGGIGKHPAVDGLLWGGEWMSGTGWDLVAESQCSLCRDRPDTIHRKYERASLS